MDILEKIKGRNGEIKELKSKGNFNSLNSNYILKIIFSNLHKKILLEIVKNSKLIQKRLNISINNYKQYCETFSSIVIELTTVKVDYNNTFIYLNKNNQSYYHIYFNDNKKEIKSDYIYEKDKVNKITIIIDYQVKSLSSLFDC